MASTVIKNWDNKTWLSSKDYIKSFNRFLTKKVKLNPKSKILDIGCGRGKILGNLSTKLRFRNKPIGIDITNHKDKDKRIRFKKINALTFFLNNKHKFDLILIKQTIHLLNLKEIVKLLDLSINNLSNKGKILILSLDTSQNELPTFKLMKNKLLVSLKRDKSQGDAKCAPFHREVAQANSPQHLFAASWLALLTQHHDMMHSFQHIQLALDPRRLRLSVSEQY